MIGLIALRDLMHNDQRIPAGAFFSTTPIQAAVLIRRRDAKFGKAEDATARVKRTYRRRDLTAEMPAETDD